MSGTLSLDELDDLRDAFGNLLSRGTRNNADLASHYSYTPERYRFYRDGSRDVIHYDLAAGNSITGFEDKRPNEEDVFVLAPAAGETLELRTAERFRYTVNFVSEVTQAFALNQSLSNADDKLLTGLDTSRAGDRSDGYYFEHRDDHADDEGDIFEKRNGSVVGSKQTVSLGVAMTVFQRLENDFNWYNVGISSWRETFTDSGAQTNQELINLSADTDDANSGPAGRGPISGNGQLFVEITADASTTGLELYAGSMSFTTLGSVAASVKGKGFELGPFAPSSNSRGTWEPAAAMRVTPGRELVNCDIRTMNLTSGDGRAMWIMCDPSNVLKTGPTTLVDGDFSPPPELSGQNAPVEVTNLSTVTQFPDETGTTGTTASNPGGYQGGFASSRSSGQESGGSDLTEKHGINDGDYAVLVVDAESATDMHVTTFLDFDE